MIRGVTSSPIWYTVFPFPSVGPTVVYVLAPIAMYGRPRQESRDLLCSSSPLVREEIHAWICECSSVQLQVIMVCECLLCSCKLFGGRSYGVGARVGVPMEENLGSKGHLWIRNPKPGLWRRRRQELENRAPQARGTFGVRNQFLTPE